MAWRIGMNDPNLEVFYGYIYNELIWATFEKKKKQVTMVMDYFKVSYRLI